MAETSRETLLQEVIDDPEGAEMSETGPGDARRFAGRFDPFRDPQVWREGTPWLRCY